MISEELLNQSREAEEKLNLCLSATAGADSKKVKIKVRQRGATRQSVTKTVNSLEGEPPTSPADVDFLVNKLNDLKVKLVTFDQEINEFMLADDKWDDEEYMRENDICEQYNDKILASLSHLKSFQNNVQAPLESSMNVGSYFTHSSTPKLRLPNVEFPIFDGKPDNFERFIESFENIINKFNLSEYEKYAYLLQQVSGPAKKIVQSVPVGNLNYADAKELLTLAFSDEITQQYSVIDRLSKLKLRSASDMYEWIGEARVLSQQMDRLKLTGSIFVQYFLWNGMSDNFKKQFISVSNTAKPTLTNIIDNSFEVFNRMQESRGQIYDAVVSNDNISKVGTFAKAVSHDKGVRFDTSGCYLCESPNNDHALKNCPNYDDATKKCERIKLLGGCIKCASPGHNVDKCKRKIGKCYKCRNFHMSFLCTNIGDVKPDSKSQVQNKTSLQSKVNLTKVNVMHAISGKDIMIPTFTMDLTKLNNKMTSFRCLLDPAAQSSFISERALKNVKHELVDQVNVEITGFNSSKVYNTKRVKFSAKVKNKCMSIVATVVPEINTNIKNPKTKKVVKSFKSGGVDLADRYLNLDDGTVHILLGVDNAHFLPIHSCSFGAEENMSTLYYCAAGTMLAGDMDILISNLSSLDVYKQFTRQMDELA